MADSILDNGNIPAEISLDIMELEILPLLRPTSVSRFRSVSRQWRVFLSSDEFLDMHLRHQTNRKLFLIDHRSCSVSTIDICESSDHVGSTTITSTPFEVCPSDVLFLASLDGLVCVCLKKTCELVIWNPLTRAFRKLSTSKSQGFYSISSDVVGLYRHSSNDYRVLHVKRRRGTMGAYVHSRRTNSWREIEFLKKHQIICDYIWSPVTLSGGSLYFLVREGVIGGEKLIVSFDVIRERFKAIPFPDITSDHRISNSNLVNVENLIHLFVGHEMMFEKNWKLSLWRMECEKWTKTKVFSGISNVPLGWVPQYVMFNGEKLVMWDYNRDVYEVDLKTKKHVCLHHGAGDWCRRLEQIIYIETLVSPST